MRTARTQLLIGFMCVALIVYFVLIAGAVVALWQAGVLGEVPLVYLLVGLTLAVGLGVLLAFAFRHPVHAHHAE